MVMSFKQWLRLEYGGHTFVFYETADATAAANARYLIEGGRTWELDKRWSVRSDPPHAPNMQKHNHLLFKGNEVSIINRDGTQSHGTSRDNVPNWVIDKLRSRDLIESVLLVEASAVPICVPAELLRRAHYRAMWFDLLLPLTRRS
jgi:hypothetical protein